ncbi:P-loop NTPase fold protein [Cohnella zeiphila]|uniref:KAP NTPase domain-containing protein n=1 Tax=Cohnella zeiphila TaxID=2761120 RepID=A0A7X0SR35_9BACL|nr:P-loop NTPase fold protein [Cohnella zeiphila]MBB6734396.1 hypothetical protein [Cohnella zeiphila]
MSSHDIEQKVSEWIRSRAETVVSKLSDLYRYDQKHGLVFLIAIGIAVALLFRWMKRKGLNQIERKAWFDGGISLLLTTGLGYVLSLIDKFAGFVKNASWFMPLLILVFLAILVRDLCLYAKSRQRILDHFVKIMQLILLIGLSLGWAYGFVWSTQGILAIFYVLFWYMGNAREKEAVKPRTLDVLSDRPVANKEDLFPSREREYERFLQLLQLQDSDEPFATAICAPWGEGKTSFVLPLLKESHVAHMIFIQPLIMDNREKLVEYFFGRLKDMLDKNGIFTGKGSSFKAYLDIVLKFVGDSKISTFPDLLMWNSKSEPLDYRETKRRFEEDILTMLDRTSNSSEKKLYVIVDDMDRLENPKETLVFIKEIADFRGCIVVFLMDYNKIIANSSSEYLEKFLHNRFDLDEVPFEEMIQFIFDHQQRTQSLKHGFIKQHANSMVDHILNEVKKIKGRAEKALAKIKQDSEEFKSKEGEESNKYKERLAKARELEHALSEFNHRLLNARKVKRMVRTCIELLEYSDDVIMKHPEIKKVETNWSELDLQIVVIQVAIIKTWYEPQYTEWIMEKRSSLFIRRLTHPLIRCILEDYLHILRSNERMQLSADARMSFMDALIFSRTEDAMFLDALKTRMDKKFAEIDEGRLTLSPEPKERIREYADLLNKYSSGVKFQERMDNFLTALIDSGIQFSHVWEVAVEIQSSKLILSSFIPRMLEYIRRQPPEFDESRVKKWVQGRIIVLKDAFAREFATPFGKLYFLQIYPDSKISEQSIKSMTDQWNSLQDMMSEQVLLNDALFDKNKGQASSVFEQWHIDVMSLLETKHALLPQNDPRKEAMQYYGERFDSLVDLLRTLEEIEEAVERTGVQRYQTEPMSRNEASTALGELNDSLDKTGFTINSNICYRFLHILDWLATQRLTETEIERVNQVWTKLISSKPVEGVDEEFWISTGLRKFVLTDRPPATA